MIMRGAVVAAVLLIAAGSIACGDTTEADPTPVQTWKITPAAGGGAATATPAAVETADATTTASDATPGAGGALQIAGVGSTFDVEDLTASAGAVTIEFDNRDAGVVHNLHVFKGTSAQGESVDATDIEVGPVQQTLELDLEAGDYYYQCDAHPTTMKGTLTVS
ncbi:MAG TPA: plastocyanin/azurin family copper-binding protein [Dehalococcoidia bacterium]|nr:plastocyanin/azurin family copper-binding protein [Dehalococcoidia bacterium]